MQKLLFYYVNLHLIKEQYAKDDYFLDQSSMEVDDDQQNQEKYNYIRN